MKELRVELAVALVVVLAAATTACSDSATGPTSNTRVEALVQDPPNATSTITGTLSGNIFASVGDGNRWIDLGSPNGITVALQVANRSTTVHGEQSVAAGSYTRARLMLQGVTARIERGSVVGGTTLTNDAAIRLGGSDQRVELSVPVDSFTVEDDPTAKRIIVFELRSQQWLSGGAVQSGQVEDAALQAAISATTRSERR